MLKSIVSLFLSFLMCFSLVCAHDRVGQMCSEAESLVARHCNVEGVPAGPQRIAGPPGKGGQKGQKGEIGPIGPSGTTGLHGEVDYSVVNATIREILGPVVKGMKSKIAELTEQLEELRERSNESLQCSRIWKCQSSCTVIYEEKCFLAIHYPVRNVTYTIAEKLCTDEGARPANIYSRSHYDSFMKNLRESRQDRYFLWLGMKINPSTKAVSLYNGNPATFTQWHPGYPLSALQYTVLELAIDSSKEKNQGMFNNQNPLAASDVLHGVLCEK